MNLDTNQTAKDTTGQTRRQILCLRDLNAMGDVGLKVGKHKFDFMLLGQATLGSTLFMHAQMGQFSCVVTNGYKGPGAQIHDRNPMDFGQHTEQPGYSNVSWCIWQP